MLLAARPDLSVHGNAKTKPTTACRLTSEVPHSITFTLAAGAGTARENNQSCSNTLTLRKVTATVLTFSEPQTAACVADTVTFTRHGADLAYRWTDNIEENTATLHRTCWPVQAPQPVMRARNRCARAGRRLAGDLSIVLN
jgi:hypothetical protein